MKASPKYSKHDDWVWVDASKVTCQFNIRGVDIRGGNEGGSVEDVTKSSSE